MSAEQDYAGALAASMVADMARAPTLERAIHSRQINERQFLAIITRDLERDLKGEGGLPLFPNLRALMRTQIQVQQRLPVGLDQFDFGAVISSVVPALAGAASSYFVARTNAQAQADIARLQLESQQLQLRQLDLNAAAARTNAAITQGVPGAAAPLPGGTLSPQAAAASGDLPSWAAPVGITVGALTLVYLVYRAARG